MLRQLALDALDKRGNIEGAAAFAAFAPLARRANVTRATSAFQAAYNLLDMLGEQPSPDPVLDGRRLHEALVYAVTPRGTTAPPGSEVALSTRTPPAPIAYDEGARALDWYEHHPQRDDGGYLDALIEECRDAFAALPSHLVAAPSAQAAAARIVAFQSLNLSKSQGEHTGLEQLGARGHSAGSGPAMVGDRRRRRLLARRARADRGRRRDRSSTRTKSARWHTPTSLGSAVCTRCWTT